VNALEALIADAVTRRLAGAGRVTAFMLGEEAASATLELAGQPAPVTIQVDGLRWSVEGEEFRLDYATARCTLPWVDVLLQAWGERQGRRIALRDDLKFLPLKLRLRRAG
jgi:hypothetical protein